MRKPIPGLYLTFEANHYNNLIVAHLASSIRMTIVWSEAVLTGISTCIDEQMDA